MEEERRKNEIRKREAELHERIDAEKREREAKEAYRMQEERRQAEALITPMVTPLRARVVVPAKPAPCPTKPAPYNVPIKPANIPWKDVEGEILCILYKSFICFCFTCKIDGCTVF